jgi:hypothetical protein
MAELVSLGMYVSQRWFIRDLRASFTREPVECEGSVSWLAIGSSWEASRRRSGLSRTPQPSLVAVSRSADLL